ncbi:MAG: hypothetical protein P8R46_03955 [Planctomycetota bacterium]|nr:hypothetical protein [Planctomycetota bacterium]
MKPNSTKGLTATLSALALVATGCGGGSTTSAPAVDPTASLDEIDTSDELDGVVPLPTTVDDRIRAVFDKYAHLDAPSGERVHFLGQPGVSDERLFRVKAVFEQLVTAAPGTSLGADKRGVLDAVAALDTTIVVVEEQQAFDLSDAMVASFTQLFDGLYASVDCSTVVQEGSPEYLLPDPAIDGTLLETSGILLRFGLGATVPDFAEALTLARLHAESQGLYRPVAGQQQGQADADYLGLILSVYYGVWGHDPSGQGTSGGSGEYDFCDRSTLQAGDPGALALIESFFAPSQAFPAYLASSFSGTFEMQFDPALAYTHRSRYLERAGFRGDITGRINGNELDNTFLGGDLADQFEGRGGADRIEGDRGADEAFFTGLSSEYTIVAVDSTVTRVTDTVPGRDGADDVRQVTRLHFSDQIIDL